MTILSSDIKLRESERMTDATDGGGRRTLNVVQDGVAGNIFPKVSRLDSVYGRVNLRKVYGHVDTPTVETYAGAHFIVTDAPDNDRIHVTAFSTASEFDNRTAARDRIESYVISGPESRMVLYGRQLMGAQALLVYQREEEPLPEIGEVYVVSNETGGITGNQQFVAIQDMDHEVRTFTDMTGEFKRRIITITIGAPLRYEFTGFDTPSRLSGSPAGAKVRGTTVADASRYFGIQPLADAAVATDLTMRVDSVYTPIVPTTQRETAISLGGVAGATAEQTTSNAATAFSGVPPLINNINNYAYCATLPKPGSVSVRIKRSDFTSPVVTDDGNGNIIGTTGAGGVFISGGTVNYTTGRVDVVIAGGPNTTSHAMELSYVPVAEVSQPAHTRAIEITLGTRGTVHTPVLSPLPAAGTLIVDYRALGKWYRLRDDGSGELSGGDSAYGTGTVNYVTGGVIITLGALPDVGSSILLSWGSPAHYEIKTNDAGTSAKFAMTLPDLPVKRASAVVTYYVNGVATTATAGVQGLISSTNSVTGSINHVTGELNLEFGAKLPDAGSVISVAYEQVVPVTPGELPLVSGSFPQLTPSIIDGAPIDPGSLALTVWFRTLTRPGYIESAQYKQVRLADDGLGNLIIKAKTDMLTTWALGAGCTVNADTIVGSIDYTTGEIELLSVDVALTATAWANSYAFMGATS